MAEHMVGNVGFEEDVKPLFRPEDQSCMIGFGLDLWNWTQVRSRALGIQQKIVDDEMPPDAPWPEAQKQLFDNWIRDGRPLRRGEEYAAYFRDIDSYTEYWDKYRPETNGSVMATVRKFFPGPLLDPAWMDYARASGTAGEALALQVLTAVLNQAEIRDAVLAIDDLVVGLVEQHFPSASGAATARYLDAMERFGRDQLPLDADRDSRIDPGDSRKAHAQFHRMDGSIMWFMWAGHLECAIMLRGEADPRHPTRTAMLAAACLGCSMDFVFRDGRPPSRPEYQRNEPTAQSIRLRAGTFIGNSQAAAREMHELFRIAFPADFAPRKLGF